MKTKKGISLVVLIITIIVMVLLAGIAIAGTTNVIEEADKSDFVVELSTIKDRIKERYLLTGSLVVKSGQQYTAQEIVAMQTIEENKSSLINEITKNNDLTNTFYVVDLSQLEVETSKRGIESDELDVFVVASNTLNVYYLRGFEYKQEIRFSTVTLASESTVEQQTGEEINQVELNDKLNVTKSSNTWTNEMKIYITNQLNDGESLQYSIAGGNVKSIEKNNYITINSTVMTNSEKTAFANNKTVIIDRIKDGTVLESKEISIDNLDIINPTLGDMEIIDTTNTSINTIKINFEDSGNSGVKAIYYDYNKILKDGTEKDYYLDKNLGSRASLLKAGKISKDGIIKLDKYIKSIFVVAVDNAGNVSDVVTYTIEDTYIVSK